MTNGNEKCAVCGGDGAIHHYQTDQCPVGGVEALVGKPQEWKSSTFIAAVIPPAPSDRLARDLTAREYFAAMAMQGIVANEALTTATAQIEVRHKGWPMPKFTASLATDYADALIEALNKEREL